MKFVIKAKDGAYKREPGDSLSSRYDDYGYSCWQLDDAVLFDEYQSAKWGLHKDGKFSLEEGAVIKAVVLAEQDCEEIDVVCPVCKGDGEIWPGSPYWSHLEKKCYQCGGDKTVKLVRLVDHRE